MGRYTDQLIIVESAPWFYDAVLHHLKCVVDGMWEDPSDREIVVGATLNFLKGVDYQSLLVQRFLNHDNLVKLDRLGPAVALEISERYYSGRELAYTRAVTESIHMAPSIMKFGLPASLFNLKAEHFGILPAAAGELLRRAHDEAHREKALQEQQRLAGEYAVSPNNMLSLEMAVSFNAYNQPDHVGTVDVLSKELQVPAEQANYMLGQCDNYKLVLNYNSMTGEPSSYELISNTPVYPYNNGCLPLSVAFPKGGVFEDLIKRLNELLLTDPQVDSYLIESISSQIEKSKFFNRDAISVWEVESIHGGALALKCTGDVRILEWELLVSRGAYG